MSFLLNVEKYILMNAGNQKVDGPHWIPLYLLLYYGSQWYGSPVSDTE